MTKTQKTKRSMTKTDTYRGRPILLNTKRDTSKIKVKTKTTTKTKALSTTTIKTETKTKGPKTKT